MGCVGLLKDFFTMGRVGAGQQISYRTDRYGRNIPYRPAIRYARPPCFVPEKIPAVPDNFGQYRSAPGVPTSTEKSFFFFFLSFVILEFLLGQNGNLFALTY